MSNNLYLYILGRQPEFGLVELESLLGADAIMPFSSGLAIVKHPSDIDMLGGTVKYGRIIYDGQVTSLMELPIETEDLPMNESKTVYGVSVYGRKMDPRELMRVGLQLKMRLRERGSVRYVAPTSGSELNAAQLKVNRIVHEGFELLIAVNGQRMVLALTEAFQDVDRYRQRDYERPARSATVGMLPPKLAQILLNTTSAQVTLDPFCGTGVVLQEALLQGRKAFGSDIAPEMVQATRKNLEWLSEYAGRDLPEWSVSEGDAQSITLPSSGISVVSEGYLGPNLHTSPSDSQQATMKAELTKLYTQTLQNLSGQLASGSELALCMPAWRQAKGWHHLGIVDDLARLGYTMKVFRHVREPLLYARSDQIVGREVLLLRKI